MRNAMANQGHAAHQVALLQLQGDGSQRPFVVLVSQSDWLTPVHGNKGFFSVDAVCNARHQSIAACGVQHRKLNRGRSAVNNQYYRKLNHGMAPLFLSFDLKQFVHDVQNGQQANHGHEDVLGPAFVFRQCRRLADGVHRQQAQQ